MQSINKWLNSQWNIYKLTEQLKLLDIQGFKAYYNFIQAIKPISFSFTGVLKVDLIQKEQKDKDAPFIINLIKEFKEYYCIQQAAPTTTTNNFVFATLQNNTDFNSNFNSNSSSNLRWNKECVYGYKYQFNDCYYIIKYKHP